MLQNKNKRSEIEGSEKRVTGNINEKRKNWGKPEDLMRGKKEQKKEEVKKKTQNKFETNKENNTLMMNRRMKTVSY
jgi:hypothetical protein